MQITVKEVVNWYHTEHKDKVLRTHEIEGETLEDCFQKVRLLRKMNQFDNARRYDFMDELTASQYRDWAKRR